MSDKLPPGWIIRFIERHEDVPRVIYARTEYLLALERFVPATVEHRRFRKDKIIPARWDRVQESNYGNIRPGKESITLGTDVLTKFANLVADSEADQKSALCMKILEAEEAQKRSAWLRKRAGDLT